MNMRMGRQMMDGWVDGWTNGWKDGWMGRQMDG